MADAYTPNYNLTLPEVGGSPDTWGDKLNQNFSQVDNNLVPSGGIIMWSGDSSMVPSSWALCDGSQGTPDLTGRFIVGAGGSLSKGDIGGSDETTLGTDNLPSHDHNVSVDDDTGVHGHKGRTSAFSNEFGQGQFVPKVKTSHAVFALGGGTQGGKDVHFVDPNGTALDDSVVDYSHTHFFEIGQGLSILDDPDRGRHSHTVTQESVGQAEPFENRPPFYALAFIMKL